MMTRDEALLSAIECARESYDRLEPSYIADGRAAAYAALGHLYVAIAALLPPASQPAPAEVDPDVAQCGHKVMAIRDATAGWLHVMNMDPCTRPPGSGDSDGRA